MTIVRATGQNLSVPVSAGFIALFGITLLNGIVLVTYLNQLIREGLPMNEASVQGAGQDWMLAKTTPLLPLSSFVVVRVRMGKSSRSLFLILNRGFAWALRSCSAH